jgi:hypothetical protein
MTIPHAAPRLDLYSRSKVELWRAAADELARSPDNRDPLVQAGLHALLAWLRADATESTTLLDLFGRPHGPLGPQLRLIGSLLGEPDPPDSVRLPRRWWQVVKAAYHARWLELTLDGERR